MLKTVNLSEVIAGKKPITVNSGVTVREASQVMSRAEKGAIMVLSEGRLRGIFTERDLLKRVVAEGLNPDSVTIDDVMTKSLVVALAIFGRPLIRSVVRVLLSSLSFRAFSDARRSVIS